MMTHRRRMSAEKVSGLVAVPLSSHRLPNRQVLMEELHGTALREVCCSVRGASEDPLGGEQPLQAHRASRVDAGRADADLRSWRQSQKQRTKKSQVYYLEHI